MSDSVLPESQRAFAVMVGAFDEEELPTASHNSCIGNKVEEKSVSEACIADVVEMAFDCGGVEVFFACGST